MEKYLAPAPRLTNILEAQMQKAIIIIVIIVCGHTLYSAARNKLQVMRHDDRLKMIGQRVNAENLTAFCRLCNLYIAPRVSPFFPSLQNPSSDYVDTIIKSNHCVDGRY